MKEKKSFFYENYQFDLIEQINDINCEKYFVTDLINNKFFTSYIFDRITNNSYINGIIEIMGSISHPSIQKISDIIINENKIIILCDYEIRNFLVLLETGLKINEEIAKEFFYQLIDGISYLHSQKIAHLDISPNSLYFSINNHLIIKNFFKSKYIFSNEIFPEINYINFQPPEVFLNNKCDPYKIDIWSCGLILYICLTYQYPFKGDSIENIIKSIINNEIKMEPYLSNEVQEILIKMLNPNPNLRPTASEILEFKWLKEKNQTIPHIFKLGKTAKKIRISTNLNFEDSKKILLPFLYQHNSKITYKNSNKDMNVQIRKPEEMLFSLTTEIGPQNYIDYIITKLTSPNEQIFEEFVEKLKKIFLIENNS